MKKYLKFVFLIFSIMLIFSSCRKEISINSINSSDFKADGYLNEWDKIDFVGVEKCNYYFASQYNDSSVILCIRVTDKKDYINIEKSGLIVSFESERGKSEISILPPIPFDKFSSHPPIPMDADSSEKEIIFESAQSLSVSSDFPLSNNDNKAIAFMRHSKEGAILDLEILIPLNKTEKNKPVGFLFTSKSPKYQGNMIPSDFQKSGFDDKNKSGPKGPPPGNGNDNMCKPQGTPQELNQNSASNTEIFVKIIFLI